MPSVVANWLLGVVTGIRLHDNGCSLKVFRAEVVKPLKLRPGMHRYLPALASQLGGRVAEVVVNHRPRRFGRSKYGLSRTFGVVARPRAAARLMREAVDPAAAAPLLRDRRSARRRRSRARCLGLGLKAYGRRFRPGRVRVCGIQALSPER